MVKKKTQNIINSVFLIVILFLVIVTGYLYIFPMYDAIYDFENMQNEIRYVDSNVNITMSEKIEKQIIRSYKLGFPNESALCLRGVYIANESLTITEAYKPNVFFHNDSAIRCKCDDAFVGTIHSHPNGVCAPSQTDLDSLNGYWGKPLNAIICGRFKVLHTDIVFFDQSGNLYDYETY
jgi:proteasome lid subunit RPN8/RPN11